MHPVWPTCSFPLLLLACLAGAASALPAAEAVPPGAGDPAIAAALAEVLRAHAVPALGGAIVTSAGLQRAGVAGVRKAGSAAVVTVADQWHLGSDTKAMTATLAARLVERGLLRWDSSVASVLPEAGPGWAAVTLDHLLVHRAGIADEPDFWHLPDRAAAVRAITAQPPATPPGAAFRYSNAGYVLAGAMLERAAGATWEELMRTQLWRPLKMADCGFGGMGSPGRLDQPWGHRADGRPAGNGSQADNPAVMGPAGTVHAPLADWAAFIADQLAGARGGAALLGKASYQHLQTPWPESGQARGWMVVPRDWAHGAALTHSGSNTMHWAVAWLAPARDCAVLVCCNQGDSGAACEAAAVALLRLAGMLP